MLSFFMMCTGTLPDALLAAMGGEAELRTVLPPSRRTENVQGMRNRLFAFCLVAIHSMSSRQQP